MKACGLSVSYLPSRRTFDRRLKTISTDIKERLSTMGKLFVVEGLVRPYVVATDTALLRSKGHIWHASSMKEGVVPCSGIDTEANGDTVIPKDGCLGTNCTWYQVLNLLLQ